MLINLHVRNLALIDEADVSFGPGLNILTGETGAGKSILIGSIALAMGQKMSADILRRDADSGLAELVFQVENDHIAEQLREMGIEPDGGQLILSRKIRKGRSVNRINGETCTAAAIRKAASLLMEIHGQHEHQALLDPVRQREILDSFGHETIDPLLAKTKETYRKRQDIEKALAANPGSEAERAREMSFLEYEIREIDEAALREGEEEELEEQYQKMAHARQIGEALGSVRQMIGEEGAGSSVSRALRELSPVAELDPALSDLESMLADTESILSDALRAAEEASEDLSFSEEAYRETEMRLDQIRSLQKRYGNSVAEILKYRERQEARLEELKNFSEHRKELEEMQKQAEAACLEAAAALTRERKKQAEGFAAAVERELKDLNFLSVSFAVGITPSGRYSASGSDDIVFEISTNPGESRKPLHMVASGGELSRIMLAIRTLLADRDETETLIFDEIDTGISGRTAQKVSEKMAQIAKKRQVICITHLAQIAAMADHHFAIEKSVADGSTISRVRELERGESIEELARILGGARITDAVMKNAEEMKNLADRAKEK